jgi:hypothetical protein
MGTAAGAATAPMLYPLRSVPVYPLRSMVALSLRDRSAPRDADTRLLALHAPEGLGLGLEEEPVGIRART